MPATADPLVQYLVIAFVADETSRPAISRATAARGDGDAPLIVLWRQEQYLIDLALLSLFYFLLCTLFSRAYFNMPCSSDADSSSASASTAKSPLDCAGRFVPHRRFFWFSTTSDASASAYS